MRSKPATTAIDLQQLDQQLIALWLHGRSPQTMRAYRRDCERLLTFTGKSLQEITLADLQRFDTSLADLAESSRARILSAVKSLFSFASKTFPAAFPVNVGAALRLPKRKDTLAERILPESAVQKMLAKEDHPRNRLILLLLYAAGLRRAELCGLCWRDLQERELADGTLTGQLVAFGKGGKTRSILLTPDTWRELQGLRGEASDDEPVFVSRQQSRHDGRKALQPSQVYNIVRQAARRAGVKKPVSPHWLRHAHASHALNRGAPISLVQATLGHSNLAITGRYTHAQPEASSAQYLSL
jgi:site-specific recombinase XerD